MARAVIWLGPILLLLTALLNMPYGYFQLLRVIVFCTSTYLAIGEKDCDGNFWLWAFIACVLIYNPIFKLSLGKEIWPFVNIATIILYARHFVVRGWAYAVFRGKR